MITTGRGGGRTVELFIPFEHNGRTVTEIALKAFRFGDTMRWAEGEFKSSLALLVELAGVDEAIIRALRYPDADRVMEAFLTMLPQDLRDDIANGRIPQKLGSDAPVVDPVVADVAPDSVDDDLPPPRGPGAPLPDEAGFDLSEEP